MEILYIMLPVAGLFALGVGLLFVWAVNNDQFEDFEREARRILDDDQRTARRGCRASSKSAE